LILGQITILLGVLRWNDKYGDESPLGIIHIVLWFAFALLVEIAYRVYQRRKPLGYVVPGGAVMTVEEFNERVSMNKEKLMVLDDLVLDVKDYMDEHPGGRFLIEYLIGRDISKFYYGGYALDNNGVKGQSKRHVHSNISHLQVQSMIIARLTPTPSTHS